MSNSDVHVGVGSVERREWHGATDDGSNGLKFLVEAGRSCKVRPRSDTDSPTLHRASMRFLRIRLWSCHLEVDCGIGDLDEPFKPPGYRESSGV
jgi:hypothetical protein